MKNKNHCPADNLRQWETYNMKSKLLYPILLATCILFSGCVKWQGALGMDTNLRQAIYTAVDDLLNNTREPLPSGSAFLVASLVNIDGLQQSSTFGRTLSEYITSRLVWHGFTTSEIKLRQSLFIKEKGGEFLLSRDVKALSQQYNAQTVIVGTYSIGEYMVYISLRLVNAENNTILATTEFEVPLGVETGKLLKNDSLF